MLVPFVDIHKSCHLLSELSPVKLTKLGDVPQDKHFKFHALWHMGSSFASIFSSLKMRFGNLCCGISPLQSIMKLTLSLFPKLRTWWPAQPLVLYKTLVLHWKHSKVKHLPCLNAYKTQSPWHCQRKLIPEVCDHQENVLLVFQSAEDRSNPGDHKSYNDMKGR